jgi:hypothetical protein
VVQDLHLGQHPVGVAHEVTEQLELGGGELDLLAGPPHLVALLVQLQVGEGQPRGRLGPLAAGAPEHGADPGEQLFETERLGDVVVAAGGEPAELILGRITGGQEDDRRAGALGAEATRDLEALHVGQHDVEHDQVRTVPLGGLHGLGARGRGDHVEARVPQAGRQQLQDVRLILDNKQPGVRPLLLIGGDHIHAP